ncbi:MAG: hypothetical protein L0Y57_12825 [Beijerinckiaceae bacterium]|nr:hypothetical protein [Beijerinckiaceae bacterium]
MTDTPPLFSPPALLTEAHDAVTFDCGESVLDDWLRNRAWHNLQVAASRTYVICPAGTSRIAGYFALSMGQILAQDVSGSMRRNMPKQIPAVTLGRLAIDRANARERTEGSVESRIRQANHIGHRDPRWPAWRRRSGPAGRKSRLILRWLWVFHVRKLSPASAAPAKRTL